MRIDVYHHCAEADVPLGDILAALQALKAQGDAIMSTAQQITDAIAKINDASNKQATALQTIADAEKKTSDNIDAIIAKLGDSVPPDVIASLQAAADGTQATSDHLAAQAAFSTALASKGADNPVPVPPPPAPTKTK